jgi:hypothetical protein
MHKSLAMLKLICLINGKLVNTHRAIINCISIRYNLHFYGKDRLHYQFSTIYRVIGRSKTMKGKDTLSISKSFAIFPNIVIILISWQSRKEQGQTQTAETGKSSSPSSGSQVPVLSES